MDWMPRWVPAPVAMLLLVLGYIAFIVALGTLGWLLS